MLGHDEGAGNHKPEKFFYLMVFIAQGHQIIVVNVQNIGRFYCLYNQPAWLLQEEAEDGEKESIVKRKPLGYLFFVFKVENAGNPFFYKIKVMAYRIFFQ